MTPTYLVFGRCLEHVEEPLPARRHFQYSGKVTASVHHQHPFPCLELTQPSALLLLDPFARPKVPTSVHGRHLPIAVVWRTPHRAQLIAVQHRVSFHTQLMRAQNMVHAVELEELAHDGRTESVPCSSIGSAGAPCGYFPSSKRRQLPQHERDLHTTGAQRAASSGGEQGRLTLDS